MDLRLQLDQLAPQGPQLAAAGDQAGGGVTRSDRQRAVSGQKLAAERDIVLWRLGGVGQGQGLGQRLHDPGLPQEPPGQARVCRLGLDELVGPAHNARPSLETGRQGLGGRLSVQPDESHPAHKTPGVLAQIVPQVLGRRNHHVLGLLAEGHLDQHRRLNAHLEQVGHQSAGRPKRARVFSAGLVEHFFDARAEPLVPLLQLLQHGDPLGKPAAALLVLGQLGLPLGLLPAQLAQAGQGGGMLLLPPIDLGRQLFPLPLELDQLALDDRQLPIQLVELLAVAIAGCQGRRRLAFPTADLAGQRGDRAHLLQVACAALLVFAAKLIEPGDQLGHAALAFGQRAGDLAMPVDRRLDRVACLVELLRQVAGADAHRRQLLAMPGNLLLQVAAVRPLVLDGRFCSGDPLAVGGQAGFGLPDGLVELAQLGLGHEPPGLQRFGLGDRRVPLVGEVAGLALQAGKLPAQPLPVDQAHLGAKLLQTVAVFLVPPRLAGLLPHAPQPAFDLFDNVRQPQQVLLDPLQSPQGLDLLGLETADAGRFLEDHAPILGGRLEQDVDLPLLDDAVGLRAQAGARQEVADVAQAARLPVDKVLPLPAAVDAAGDVDFGGVDSQPAAGIIDRQGDLGRVHRPPCARAVEDDVGHLLAPQALDALLAEHPLDGVDDVRFAGAVRADDYRNSGGELESRAVRKTLETDEFEGLEHGRLDRRKNKLTEFRL